MKDVVVLMGDGIGPEVISLTTKVIDTFELPIKWHYKSAGISGLKETGHLIPQETIDAIRTHKVVLKGPMTTPIGESFKSVNVQMRKLFNLYSNIRPSSTDIKIHNRYNPFDIVVFRENIEGLYGGKEYYSQDGTAIAEKVVTKKNSQQIMKSACEFAVKNGYKKVTIGHKANILKQTDGLFLKEAKKIGNNYPDLKVESLIIDNLFAKVVSKPEDFEVIVTMNLYGDILSDLLGGMVGSIGVLPSMNIGDNIAFFEPVHGSAPDIAGMSLANPIGALLSGAMMLEYMGYNDAGDRLISAVKELVNSDNIKSNDMGGSSTTEEIGQALIKRLLKK